MRVIGVLDLQGGRAVHARGGRRHAYQPVRSHLISAMGDAIALARAYREKLSLRDMYIADLDAIAGQPPQRSLVRSIAALGGWLAVDAGVSDSEQARQVIDDGATRVVVALETLTSFDDLERVAHSVGAERVTFSLDLRNGRPVVRSGGHLDVAPLRLVERGSLAGARSVIVLDLARVGTGRGVDVALLRRIRRAFPDLELFAGGGVRNRADLALLADAGCDGALVATALHGGTLTADDIAGAADRRRSWSTGA